MTQRIIRVVGFAAWAAVGCHQNGAGPMTLEEMVPAWGSPEEAVAVSILGAHFDVAVEVDFGHGQSRVDDTFRAQLGSLPLTQVTRLSSRELTAVIPPGLSPGEHTLSVTGPNGQRVELPRAYWAQSCEEDLDDDGLADCDDGCIDVDGDGVGRPPEVSDCDVPFGDEDDTNPYVCTDSDGDGCDDCTGGRFDPLDDGWDPGGDGACDHAPTMADGQALRLEANASTLSVATAVDPAHTALFFSLTHDSTSPNNGQVTAQLNDDGTQIIFERSGSQGNVAVNLRYDLWTSSLITVQRGTFTFESEPGPRQIVLGTPVDPTRSFLLTSLRNIGQHYNRDDWVRGEFVDGETIELTMGDICCNGAITWQVVELAASTGATVHHGRSLLDAGALSVTTPLPAPAPLGRSFLVFTHSTTSTAMPPRAADYLVRGRLTSSQSLTFDRHGNGAVEQTIAWSVVTWDAFEVQRGDVTLPEGVKEMEIPLPHPVDPSRSWALLPGYQRQGAANLRNSDRVGVGWVTSELTDDGGAVRLHRGAASVAADVRWVVVEVQ